jgi:hypothetical protein
MSFRLALESLDETSLLDVDRTQPLANCSLTRYRREGEVLQLASFADTAYLDTSEVETTHEDTAAEASDRSASHDHELRPELHGELQDELHGERTT